ncbi:unnamed protein product [Calypogeia fissa]
MTEGANRVAVYHEQQRLQLCLLHTLNNLLQKKEFTKKELDGIADSLPSMSGGTKLWSPLKMVFKGHRNTLTGDYDVNVLYAALASRGKEVIWYDRRHGVVGFNPIATYGSKFVGIIVNVPILRYAKLFRGRHWVALRMVDGQWYNLDSDMRNAFLMSNGEDELKQYLDTVFSIAGEVLIVVEKDVPKAVPTDVPNSS